MRTLGIVIGIIFFLSLPFMCQKAFGAESVGVYGAIHNGHSYSSDDKIDPPGYVGYGIKLQYERGVDNGRGIDFTYSLGATAFSFGKRNNFTMRSGWEYAVVPFVEGRIYYRDFLTVSPFVGLGAGPSFATDGLNGAVIPVYGIEKSISDNLSAEIYGSHVVTTERRHDLYGVGIKYRF